METKRYKANKAPISVPTMYEMAATSSAALRRNSAKSPAVGPNASVTMPAYELLFARMPAFTTACPAKNAITAKTVSRSRVTSGPPISIAYGRDSMDAPSAQLSGRAFCRREREREQEV
jgi:hypothetical protein